MSLNDEAEAIAAVLTTTGTRAFTYWDASLPVPSYSVATGSPWLENGLTFGKFKSRWVVYAIVANASVTATLSASRVRDLTEDAVVALVLAGYGHETTGTITQFNSGVSAVYAVPITITKEINL